MTMETRSSRPPCDPSNPACLAWLQRVAGSIVYKGVSADDVVTDVLLKTKCEPRSEAYYVRLLTTTAIDHWRKERHRMHMPIEVVMSLADPVCAAAEAAVYDRALAHQAESMLSCDEVRVFKRLADGAVVREIAEDEGVTHNALKTRIYRSRARLTRALGDASHG